MALRNRHIHRAVETLHNRMLYVSLYVQNLKWIVKWSFVKLRLWVNEPGGKTIERSSSSSRLVHLCCGCCSCQFAESQWGVYGILLQSWKELCKKKAASSSQKCSVRPTAGPLMASKNTMISISPFLSVSTLPENHTCMFFLFPLVHYLFLHASSQRHRLLFSQRRHSSSSSRQPGWCQVAGSSAGVISVCLLLGPAQSHLWNSPPGLWSLTDCFTQGCEGRSVGLVRRPSYGQIRTGSRTALSTTLSSMTTNCYVGFGFGFTQAYTTAELAQTKAPWSVWCSSPAQSLWVCRFKLSEQIDASFFWQHGFSGCDRFGLSSLTWVTSCIWEHICLDLARMHEGINSTLSTQTHMH